MSFIVEVQNLVKQYPGAAEPAVKGVSFGILKGEVFSLLGPNGAGKTTTLSILSCLLDPDSGDALVAGHSVKREPQVVKRAIGVVPQDIALYPTLSARENLHFWGQMYGMGGSELKKRVDEVLEVVGLRERAKDQRPHRGLFWRHEATYQHCRRAAAQTPGGVHGRADGGH